MRFANIHMMRLFWLVPVLAAFYFWAFKKRRRLMETFARKELLHELTASLNIRKQRLKVLLTGTSVILIIFALMRPQWGFHWQEVKRKGLDIMIAVDTSRSMLTADIKPNRLERTKLAVRDFVKNLRGDRIGLIAFAGDAFVQSPLTVDYNGFLLSLDSIDTEIIPKGGTSLSGAIREAVRGFEGSLKKHRVLILITDGEDHEGNLMDSIEEAKKEGIKIFSIGIGTEEGELISIADKDGKRTFLKDRQGNVVKSRLDEATLKEIALKTGGSYVRAGSTEFGLNLIYEQKISRMEKREIEARMAKQHEERFQIPLLSAFILLIIEGLISDKRKAA